MTVAQVAKTLQPRIVLALSLLAFCVRAVQYALIDAFFPLLFLIPVVVVLMLVALVAARYLNPLVKVWAVFLIIYGGLRLALGALTLFGLVPSATAEDAVTAIFVASSALFVMAGVYLLRRSVVVDQSTQRQSAT